MVPGYAVEDSCRIRRFGRRIGADPSPRDPQIGGEKKAVGYLEQYLTSSIDAGRSCSSVRYSIKQKICSGDAIYASK